MKRPSQLLAWLILKPLGVACQNGGAIAFYLVERDFLQEHCGSETAQELWTMFTPRLVASTVLLLFRIIFWVVVFKYYKVVKSWGNSYDIGDRMTAMMFK